MAVALSLTGRGRDASLEISMDDLNKNNSLKTILGKLDSVFLKEEKDCKYDAYMEFDQIMREHGIPMADLYHRV